MLDSVDDDCLFILEDFVDYAVVTSRRGSQPLELADEWLAKPLGVVSDRSQSRLQGSAPHLLRQAVEMSETLGDDLDLLQPRPSDLMPRSQPLALGGLTTRTAQGFHQLVVANNVETLPERFEVVRAQQHEGRPAVSSHEDPMVLQLDAIGQFGQVRLDLGERQRVTQVMRDTRAPVS